MTKIEHYIFGEKAHLSSTSSHPSPIPTSSPPIQSPFPNYILSQHLLDDSQMPSGLTSNINFILFIYFILQLAENHRTGIPPKSVAQLLLNYGEENENNAIFTLKTYNHTIGWSRGVIVEGLTVYEKYREMGFMDSSTFLLLQVTSTNSLESFHSELKKITSSLHGLIGAVHGIVNIDCKKRSKAESASFDFRIKKVSTYGVDDDILKEIQKFPFPFQQLIIKEACAVINRLEKGKEQQKGTESQKIAVGELTKRMRDRYWRVEEMGDVERMQSFISMLEAFVDLIISRFDNNSSGKT
ncbi:hypothetical protein RhiirC2_794225 [Rhizophagus irregularis]|uniref:Uncharacterized protein n=1 Tax=Rhizophagus irregularis TaxID=588596 RepID=A0A2N1MDW8_9GLOM|nr:hypothetical protein RhiirC2_794225 [Rhizophagus irregularis]